MDWNSSKALAVVTSKVYKYKSFGELSLLVHNMHIWITNIFVPGYLGIMVTRQTTVLLYFCCNKRQIWLFFS